MKFKTERNNKQKIINIKEGLIEKVHTIVRRGLLKREQNI